MKIKKFLSQSPLFALYRGQSLVLENFQARLAKDEIHFLQALILTAIFFEDRQVRPFELASQFEVSKSNLSHSLRNLEKKGWLRRSMHAEDARGYLFDLTAAGRKKAMSLVKIFDEVEGAIEKRVSIKSSREFITVLDSFVISYRAQYSLDRKA